MNISIGRNVVYITSVLIQMNGHYISFKDENNAENEILRVFPAELRRQYQPESTERTMSVGEFTVQVMHMVYKITKKKKKTP